MLFWQRKKWLRAANGLNLTACFLVKFLSLKSHLDRKNDAVNPAKVGFHPYDGTVPADEWVPAFAGMTILYLKQTKTPRFFVPYKVAPQKVMPID